MEQTYFRKGFGLKKELRPVIDAEYQSALVERIRSRGYTDTFGGVTVRLAQEFGFCYGVDRAVDYAYETVHKFPEKTIFLVGEIIHNPHVNQRMTDMGIDFIYPDGDGAFDFSHVTADDVVILPAFGVTLHDFEELKTIGCILVDTTCGSVLHVWKRVESYARDGFTSVIHGKYTHEA
ncbi:MAG: 4-hydroxy-3-methylbut-2-enyl diphosphate reductase, partial [Gemmatimonadetes bacterium]|nr:4-hydroxy-3-methylbut-2-enyl diphosphate reductase [Gemmatimonadota bacterium]